MYWPPRNIPSQSDNISILAKKIKIDEEINIKLCYSKKETYKNIENKYIDACENGDLDSLKYVCWLFDYNLGYSRLNNGIEKAFKNKHIHICEYLISIEIKISKYAKLDEFNEYKKWILNKMTIKKIEKSKIKTLIETSTNTPLCSDLIGLISTYV